MSTEYMLDIVSLTPENQLEVGLFSSARGGTWVWRLSHLQWGHLAGQHCIDDSISFIDEYGKPVSWDEMMAIIDKAVVVRAPCSCRE